MSWVAKSGIPSEEEIHKAARWFITMLQAGPLSSIGYNLSDSKTIGESFSAASIVGGLPLDLGIKGVSLYNFTTTKEGGLQIDIDFSTSDYFKSKEFSYDRRRRNISQKTENLIREKMVGKFHDLKMDLSQRDVLTFILSPEVVKEVAGEFDRAIKYRQFAAMPMLESDIIIDGKRYPPLQRGLY